MGSASPIGTKVAIAGAAALAAMSPVHAQGPSGPPPVLIGVIDTRVSDAPRDGLAVTYRNFVGDAAEGVEQINRHKTHGDVVLDAIAEARTVMGDGRTYTILAANPILRTQDGGLAISRKGLMAAVDWFKENGVKVVATSFASQVRTPAMDEFEARTRAAGMTVVASVGNDAALPMPWPAAYPTVVAIDGYHYRQPRSHRRDEFLARADGVFDGSTRVVYHPNGVDRRDDGQSYESTAPDRSSAVQGSSFASARAATFIAANIGDTVSVQSARDLLARSRSARDVPVKLTLSLSSPPLSDRVVLQSPGSLGQTGMRATVMAQSMGR